jgi:hypothetical protein
MAHLLPVTTDNIGPSGTRSSLSVMLTPPAADAAA